MHWQVGGSFAVAARLAAVGDQTGGSFTSTMSRTDSAFPNRDQRTVFPLSSSVSVQRRVIKNCDEALLVQPTGVWRISSSS